MPQVYKSRRRVVNRILPVLRKTFYRNPAIRDRHALHSASGVFILRANCGGRRTAANNSIPHCTADYQ